MEQEAVAQSANGGEFEDLEGVVVLAAIKQEESVGCNSGCCNNCGALFLFQAYGERRGRKRSGGKRPGLENLVDKGSRSLSIINVFKECIIGSVCGVLAALSLL